MAESGEFRPERRIVLVNALAAGLMVVLGVVFASVTWQHGPLGSLVLAALFIPVSAVILIRCFMIRVWFDRETLHIVGYVSTKHISRSEVLTVEQDDLQRPMIRWAPPNSPDRWSVMSALSLPSGLFVPSGMLLRRRRFLAQLRLWAPDADLVGVAPGLRTRLGDGLGRLALTVWESPGLRVILSVLSIGAAAALYWFEWTRLTEVVTGAEDFTRGMVAVVGATGLAAEASYWLLPLRRRHATRWHIVLGVALAPLVVLLAMAIFA